MVTCKEIFPLIVENKLYFGINCGSKTFNTPEGTKKFGNIVWFTNLNYTFKKHIDCTQDYVANLYPKYDTYDAIDVSKTKNIPKNYSGIMGVPISFLTKYSPDQFEIIGEFIPILNGKKLFRRILIRHKK